MGPGPNMKGLSRKHVLQACEASLKRLQLDTIDLYQIHRFDPAVPMEETLAAMDLLVSQGKVRYVGASSGPSWKFMKALALADLHGRPRFRLDAEPLQPRLPRGGAGDAPLCAAEGIAVLPWSPLARGLLAGTRPRPDDRTATPRAASDDYAWKLYDHPADADVMEATRKVAEARGAEMAEVALAWLLSKPVVTAPIVGATKLGHLATALRALDVTLTDDEVRALEAPYRPHGVRGWT